MSDDRHDPALVGRTIAGKFVVEKFLGGGAMGAVYRARRTALEKNVAVKVLHREVAHDAQFQGALPPRSEGGEPSRSPELDARHRLRRGARGPALHAMVTRPTS